MSPFQGAATAISLTSHGLSPFKGDGARCAWNVVRETTETSRTVMKRRTGRLPVAPPRVAPDLQHDARERAGA
jgi:hypothetical protein